MTLERTSQDARDLVQDTLERALRSIDQFRPGTNIKLWLGRIMFNLFVDRYRRRSHELGHEPLEGHELGAAESEDRPAWEHVEADRVHGALARLEPCFREVFELHHTDRRSYRDIGARLGIPVGTVATRLLRARRKLRRMLGPTPDQPA
jgi:RNA polymerase sigma-70 factor (ECF subfamily)